MPILNQHIQCQIADLSEACARYWELRGIAPEARKEMQMELEQHFIQAARDGKTLEAVVGANPAAFASAWAREMHPRLLRGGKMILPGLIYALSIVSTLALCEQIIARTSSFTFTLLIAYILISSGLLALMFPLGGFLAPRIKTRLGRAALLSAVLLLAGLALRATGVRINWDMALFSWNWPLTLVLVGLAMGLSGLEIWRQSSHKQSSVRERLSLWRTALTFAGHVALFDLVIGISSIAVFSVCTLTGKIL